MTGVCCQSRPGTDISLWKEYHPGLLMVLDKRTMDSQQCLLQGWLPVRLLPHSRCVGSKQATTTCKQKVSFTVSMGTIIWRVTFWPAEIVEPGAGAPKENWAWTVAKREMRTTVMKNFILVIIGIVPKRLCQWFNSLTLHCPRQVIISKCKRWRSWQVGSEYTHVEWF